jgi:endonuclease YncB( thermonuclease family)
MHNGKGEKIRLYGIDCPEKLQALGNKAKQFAPGMVFKKVVKVEPVTTDRYGRTIAWVIA